MIAAGSSIGHSRRLPVAAITPNGQEQRTFHQDVVRGIEEPLPVQRGHLLRSIPCQ